MLFDLLENKEKLKNYIEFYLGSFYMVENKEYLRK